MTAILRSTPAAPVDSTLRACARDDSDCQRRFDFIPRRPVAAGVFRRFFTRRGGGCR